MNRIFIPSASDKILQRAHGFTLEGFRCTDDDGDSECYLTFEIRGTLESQADARALLGALLREFDGGESEARHA